MAPEDVPLMSELPPPPPLLAPPPPPPPAGRPVPPPPTSLAPPPGAAAGRALVLLVGAVVTFFVIVSTATSLAAALGREERIEPVSFPAGIQRVVVTVDSGPLEIRGSDRSTVSGERRLTVGVERPTVSETVTGDTLRIDTSCDWWGWGWCGAGYVLDVPRSVSVEAVSRAGGVIVSGIDGEVTARSSGGRVSADDLSGKATLTSQAGGVTATGMRSRQVVADSSAGRVSVSFAQAPDAVDAHSSAGGVRIEVPRDDTVYRVDAHSSAGETDIAVNNGPTAGHSIGARSSAGSVEVVYPNG
jgi:hypothetical protein